MVTGLTKAKDTGLTNNLNLQDFEIKHSDVLALS